jgi:hypothetical protein
MFDSRRPAWKADGLPPRQNDAHDLLRTDDVWDLFDLLDLGLFGRRTAMPSGTVEPGALIRRATRDEEVTAGRLPCP